MENKKCLNCDDPILNGRTDKKFCGDACRNYHHNGLNQHSTACVRNISNTLKRNRRALQAYVKKGTASIQELTMNGFNFDYYTHKDQQQDIFFVYDFGYKFSDGLFVNVVNASSLGKRV